ncbi:hypothetical protein B7494_g8568 [Chlorociboria aeruginascens]|nr:hypothetical protein B7494_g8568 [Chlorociboria aeruginascens]
MYYSFTPSPPSTSYTASPMEIPSNTRPRSQSPSCAFPSWPRRSSLSSNSSIEEESPATSFLSDVELFPSVFDDAEQDQTPPFTPPISRSPSFEAQVVDHGELMRELIAQHQAQQMAAPKKEKKRRRSSSSTSRKSSRSNSSKPMSPIAEAGE